mmetsp:Transcript_6710/g.10778  ORF Transcript_6710/g.10778 Transcript_6710/m.10778 type:complete len:95 (+) Transcript_6710:602-886(+)
MATAGLPSTLKSVSKLTREEITLELRKTADERRRVADTMSHFVSTRPYRAPEVIMLEEYGFAVDMWAAGCSMYELYSACPSNRQKHTVLFNSIN